MSTSKTPPPPSPHVPIDWNAEQVRIRFEKPLESRAAVLAKVLAALTTVSGGYDALVEASLAVEAEARSRPGARSYVDGGRTRTILPDDLLAAYHKSGKQAFDRATTALTGALKAVDSELERTAASIASAMPRETRFDQELRNHYKARPATKRFALVAAAVERRDVATIAAVLAADVPPDLVGLGADELAALRARAEVVLAPEAVAARASLTELREVLANADRSYRAKAATLAAYHQPAQSAESAKAALARLAAPVVH